MVDAVTCQSTDQAVKRAAVMPRTPPDPASQEDAMTVTATPGTAHGLAHDIASWPSVWVGLG